jgi:hypothetical protein
VDIGREQTRVVQGSNPNESDLRAVTVVTPKGGLAFAAPVNVVRAISTGHRNSFQLAARYLYRRSLDNRIEDKCAARMPLAIRAMAAVHTHRFSQKLVPHLATGTAAPGFLVFGIGPFFHVLPPFRFLLGVFLWLLTDLDDFDPATVFPMLEPDVEQVRIVSLHELKAPVTVLLQPTVQVM